MSLSVMCFIVAALLLYESIKAFFQDDNDTAYALCSAVLGLGVLFLVISVVMPYEQSGQLSGIVLQFVDEGLRIGGSIILGFE